MAAKGVIELREEVPGAFAADDFQRLRTRHCGVAAGKQEGHEIGGVIRVQMGEQQQIDIVIGGICFQKPFERTGAAVDQDVPVIDLEKTGAGLAFQPRHGCAGSK